MQHRCCGVQGDNPIDTLYARCKFKNRERKTNSGGGKMSKFRVLAAAGLAMAFAVAGASESRAEYPERPITLIVPWGAGGGTDATGRIIATLLQEELGTPVNVVNRTGGSGVVGHAAIAAAKPDGYTIGVATVEIGMMHWAGLTKLNYENYTPIVLYNSDPAGVVVGVDSEWDSVQDVLAAVAADPGEFKASGSGQGGIWHLAVAGMLNANGVETMAVPWVPSKGAAAALQELVAGGVDLVTSSIVESSGLLDAGKVKALAVMSDERLPAFSDVQTLDEAGATDWTAAAWRGIVGPADMPEDIQIRLQDAMEVVWNSDDFQDFMNGRGFGLTYLEGDAFKSWMEQSDTGLGEVMAAVGLAK
jgi:tripartite-type tricarboxylate transporter receptor subunit TctC